MSPSSKPSNSRQDQRDWLCELHRELETIYREQQFGGSRPSIRLSNAKSHWGAFDPIDFEISISLTLVQECPWWVVIEILKHEIAHLFVHVYSPQETRPHGECFREFCTRLRVADWARGATVGKTLEELRMLYDWRCNTLDERTEKHRERLRKLLALANSSNEHEAMLAMQRARELQEKQRLQTRSDPPDDFVNLEINSGKQRHAPYQGRITSILINHYHVEVVYISRYSVQTRQEVATIDLMGRREDVLLAHYVHDFLHRSAESLWKNHRKITGAKGLRARNSYIRGLLVGFHEKLDSESNTKTDTDTDTDTDTNTESRDAKLAEQVAALILVENRKLCDFKKRRYPRLVSRGSSARVDASAFSQGKSEGGRLSIRDPISKASGTPKLLH